ncbi:MAG: hypothetical protein JO168_05305 [Solirubrobacterales bacterium]|nr:hypothetical protein [Solirubrobacterales bacterium]
MNATRSEVPPETRGAVITTDLRRALEPTLITELLGHFGLSELDIATATATNPRSVRRWKLGTEPTRTTAERLDDLRNVIVLMRESEGMSDRAIVLWLRQRNRELEDHRPLEVLAHGLYSHVRNAALGFLDRDHPPTPPLPDTVRRALDGHGVDTEPQTPSSDNRASRRSRARPLRAA